MLGNRRSRRRGFTLTELIAAVSIAALLGAVAYASAKVVTDGRTLDSGAGSILGALRRARALSVTGRAYDATAAAPAPSPAPPAPPSPGPGPGPSPSPPAAPPAAPALAPPADLEPVDTAGVEIVDTTSIRVFAVSRSGQDRTLAVVSLPSLYPNTDLQIIEPVPLSRVVFRRNGTRDLGTSDLIRLQDMRTNRIKTISINGAGIARVE